MYVARRDMEYLRAHTAEERKLLQQYKDMFGKNFVVFNYETFKGTKDLPAAYFYLEALRKAVETGEPYLKKPTYEEFGH